MTTTKTGTPIPAEDENTGNGLDDAIRYYVRTYVLWHGQTQGCREIWRLPPHSLCRRSQVPDRDPGGRPAAAVLRAVLTVSH